MFHGLYLVWPEYTPHAAQLTALQASYRVTTGDAYVILIVVLNVALTCALSFFLTSAVLKKKHHI